MSLDEISCARAYLEAWRRRQRPATARWRGLADPFEPVEAIAKSAKLLRDLRRDFGNLGLADIALREIIEDKMTFEMPEIIQLTRPTARNRKRPQSWGKHQAAA